MAEEKFDGVVLRETPLGETGKRLVVLAKDLGKITVSAKAPKAPKATFRHQASFFRTALLQHIKTETSIMPHRLKL